MLSPDAYDKLMATRRQVGARTGQVNSLRSALNSQKALVDQLAEAVQAMPDGPDRQKLIDILSTRSK
ncbi:MAG TPA: hypothetical protein VF821_29045 [Lentzea sp.]